MGVLFDYFVAESDEAAASVVEDGPGPTPRGPVVPVAQPRRRGLFRRRPRSAPPLPEVIASSRPDPEPSRFPAVDGKGIDPFVMMGTLEALLTGRTYEEVEAERGAEGPLAMLDGGERLVSRLPDGLVATLAGTSEDQLREVAVPWSRTEEFWAHGDPDDLAGFLRDLADLARLARSDGQHVYCWTCM